MSETEPEQLALAALSRGENVNYVPPRAFDAIGGAHIGWKLHVSAPRGSTNDDYKTRVKLGTVLLDKRLPFSFDGQNPQAKSLTIYPRGPSEAENVVSSLQSLDLHLPTHAAMQSPVADDFPVAEGITARFSTEALTPAMSAQQLGLVGPEADLLLGPQRADAVLQNVLFTRFGPRGIGLLLRDLFFTDIRTGDLVCLAASEKASAWSRMSSLKEISLLRATAHKAHLGLFGDFYYPHKAQNKIDSDLGPPGEQAFRNRIKRYLPILSAEDDALYRELVTVAVHERRGVSNVTSYHQLIDSPDMRCLVPHFGEVFSRRVLPCLLDSMHATPPISIREMPERLYEWTNTPMEPVRRPSVAQRTVENSCKS